MIRALIPVLRAWVARENSTESIEASLIGSKSPAVKTRTETYRAFAGIHSNFAHRTVIVRIRRNDNVNVLDNALEGLRSSLSS